MKYIQFPDIRNLASWKNPNAARLYTYMAMSCDPNTGAYVYSRRWTCREIDITEDAYRHALTILERDGLIRKAPPRNHPSQHPREHPTPPPHITIVRINELYGSNPPSSTPISTPSITPSSTPAIRKNKKINLTHPHARKVLGTSVKDLMKYCSIGEDQAMNALRAFASAMNSKGKEWEDTADMKAHLLDWVLKHYLREKSVTTAARTAEQIQEREAAMASQTSAAEDKADKVAFQLSHLMAVVKNEHSRQLVMSWHQNGAWYDDELRRATAQAFDANPGLRERIADALGFDVLLQTTLHL